MLDRNTYNLETGEWKQVSDEYLKLEAEALRQYMTLPEEMKDAYFQLLLFPVQAMANIYEMYYAQAMNHALYKANDPAANVWADKVEACFARDKFLHNQYNNEMAGGKWKTDTAVPAGTGFWYMRSGGTEFELVLPSCAPQTQESSGK